MNLKKFKQLKFAFKIGKHAKLRLDSNIESKSLNNIYLNIIKI